MELRKTKTENENNETQLTKKRTFLEWHQEDREIQKKARKSPWYWYRASLPFFIAVACIFTLQQIGYGAYKYSEKAYTDIRTAIDANLTEEYGVDEIQLRKLVDKTVEIHENGKSWLECTKKDGFFEAIVTVELAENFSVVDTRRNYDSVKEFAEKFRLYLLIGTIAGGIALWGIVGLIVRGIFAMFAGICRASEKRKEAKREMETEVHEPEKEVEEKLILLEGETS